MFFWAPSKCAREGGPIASLVVHGSWLMARMEMGAHARSLVVHGSWVMAHMEMGGSCVLGAQGVIISNGCLWFMARGSWLIWSNDASSSQPLVVLGCSSGHRLNAPEKGAP